MLLYFQGHVSIGRWVEGKDVVMFGVWELAWDVLTLVYVALLAMNMSIAGIIPPFARE